MVPLQDGTLETSLDPQCGGTITGCGATLAPVRITLESIPGEATQIFPSSGGLVTINQTTDVIVLRAFQAQVVTNACSAVPETGLHIESLSLRIQE